MRLNNNISLMIKFYAVVQGLRHWCHYMLPKEFVLYSDHQSLRYLYSQNKLSFRYVKLVKFLQDYTFVLRYHAEVDNKAVDALNRVIIILHSMQNFMVGFEHIKDKYPQYPDIDIIYKESLDNLSPIQGDFLTREGYLFKSDKFVFSRTH